MNYGITLGAGVQFLLNQSGRTINEALEIIDYGKDTDITPRNDFNIGLRVSPFIGYHLSEHLVARLNPNWMLQRYNVLGQSNQKAIFQQFSLNLGVQYGF